MKQAVKGKHDCDNCIHHCTENNTQRGKCTAEKAEEILSGLNTEYESLKCTEDGCVSYKVAAQADMREEIFLAFSNGGASLLELSAASKSIEDVFREYTDDSFIEAKEAEEAAVTEEAVSEEEAENDESDI